MEKIGQIELFQWVVKIPRTDIAKKISKMDFKVFLWGHFLGGWV